MSTPCLTILRDGDNKDIAVLYRHWDGYPSGHGVQLRDFLKNIKLTDGIGGDPKMGEAANGWHCLAAQIVEHFKSEVGQIYLYAPGAGDLGEDYVYVVKPGPSGIHLEVQDYDRILYNGPLGDFVANDEGG